MGHVHEATHSPITKEYINNTSPTLPTHHHLTPITRHLSKKPSSPHPNMLSPIMFQQGAKDEREKTVHDNNRNYPISDALNLAPSSASLKEGICTLYIFLRSTNSLWHDGMNRTVSTLADKLETLETRVKVLEETDDTKTLIAQHIFSAAYERYLEMESTVRDCTAVINTLNKKCTEIYDLSTRVQNMDKHISERKESHVPGSITYLK